MMKNLVEPGEYHCVACARRSPEDAAKAARVGREADERWRGYDHRT